MLQCTLSHISVAAIALACLACDKPDPTGGAASATAKTPPAVAAPSLMPTVKPASTVKKRDASDCPEGATADFSYSDPAVEKVVRVQLQKASGDITTAELAKVKSMNLVDAKQNEFLDPCIFPHLKGLKSLYFGRGDLEDISVLTAFTKLESLRLSITRVSDLSPLEGLTNLDRLDIGRTPVKDLKPLAKLENLSELMLDETEVSDLTPLSGLKKLENLSIKRTRVKDISPLKDLPNLKNLYINGSLVEDIGMLQSNTQLKIHQN